MSEKKISYMDRSFEDYRESLREMVKAYYPELSNDFDDASIGSWLIDLISAVADNLSYHIDSVYTETNINTANQVNSLFSIARSNGFKVPGPTCSLVELTFSVVLPANGDKPNYVYAPVIKANSKVKAGNGTYFETVEDIDFKEQFNRHGVSDRTEMPYGTKSGKITHYLITKTVMAISGESHILKESVNSSMLTPFYELVLPFKNVVGIESIIFKNGIFNDNPTSNEFAIDDEHVNYNGVDIYRYFEVDSLAQLYRWGDAVSYEDSKGDTYITRGAWKPLTQKFITEYNENGYLKVIFGAGDSSTKNVDVLKGNTTYAQHVISKMVYNNNLGKKMPSNTTMYVKYRVGGGKEANVPANTITTLSNINCEFIHACDRNSQEENRLKNEIYASISVTNKQPSISGKNSPTVDELRMLIKYHNASQERCMTLKDYEQRVCMMPSRYGCVFRVSAVEENNKIMLYVLNLDNDGKLSKQFNETLIYNMTEYLSKYRTLNDFVEIKPARIINVGFDVSIFVDKTYTVEYVVKECIETIKSYMDVNKRQLGEDIFIGDLEKEIGKIDGVVNLINLDVVNIVGDGSDYSSDMTTQQTTDIDGKNYRITLKDTDYTLYSNSNEMFEIKNPSSDIRIFVKTR